MKRLSKFIKESVLNPIEDVIRPQAIRFYKDTRPRDANAYQYRYPSPASEAVDHSKFEANLDYRLPFKDSVHDIKNYKHISAKEAPVQVFMTNGLTADINKQIDSGLTRCA